MDQYVELPPIDPILASNLIEKLRVGLPPDYGVSYYSVGYGKLTSGVKRHHFDTIQQSGKIRFVSGQWGSGKTHLFALLRELAEHENLLVSTVPLSKDEAPLSSFERVFYTIMRRMVTPEYQRERGTIMEANMFDRVLREALSFLMNGKHDAIQTVEDHSQFEQAVGRLMSDPRIDIDFKLVVKQYWETFLASAQTEPQALIERRGRLVQWFAGEGKLADARRDFKLSKMIDKSNAKLMMRSLAGFVNLAGYRGLLILFDEAEQSLSVMRKAQLQDAFNNLLTLINSVQEIPNLLMIYATVPDFFNDPKIGIKQYGALSSRIGQPKDQPPRAIDPVWNLDQIDYTLESYQLVALNIRDIYAIAYPDPSPIDGTDDARVRDLVQNLRAQYSNLSAVSFWRILTKGTVTYLDDCMEGDVRPVERLYDDVMDDLRET